MCVCERELERKGRKGKRETERDLITARDHTHTHTDLLNVERY